MPKELVANINPLIKDQIDGLLQDATQTLLYNAKEKGIVFFNSSNPPIITLSDSIKNYDSIVIETVFITGGTYFINPTYIANPEILGITDNIDNLRNGGCILDVYNTTYQTSTKRIVVCFSTDTSLMLTGVLNDDPNHTDIGIRNIYGIKTKCSTYDNYSTNEVKIGTWIDGKTIYRQIIDLGVTNLPIGLTTIPHNISGIDMLTNLEVIFRRVDSLENMGRFPYIGYDSSNNIIYSYAQVTPTDIRFTTNVARPNYKMVVIMEYTKKELEVRELAQNHNGGDTIV